MESLVYVTNNSDVEFSDGYNGVVYDFKKGATLQVPETVARHVFGWGDEDKEPYLVRLGWIRSTVELAEGMSKLDKFQISTEEATKNHVLSPVVERVPLPIGVRPGQARGKVRSVA
jgi:hypothetical protein